LEITTVSKYEKSPVSNPKLSVAACTCGTAENKETNTLKSSRKQE
jgi:hypothetical protein